MLFRKYVIFHGNITSMGRITYVKYDMDCNNDTWLLRQVSMFRGENCDNHGNYDSCGMHENKSQNNTQENCATHENYDTCHDQHWRQMWQMIMTLLTCMTLKTVEAFMTLMTEIQLLHMCNSCYVWQWWHIKILTCITNLTHNNISSCVNFEFHGLQDICGFHDKLDWYHTWQISHR
jgi:hypothetical protein